MAGRAEPTEYLEHVSPSSQKPNAMITLCALQSPIEGQLAAAAVFAVAMVRPRGSMAIARQWKAVAAVWAGLALVDWVDGMDGLEVAAAAPDEEDMATGSLSREELPCSDPGRSW